MYPAKKDTLVWSAGVYLQWLSVSLEPFKLSSPQYPRRLMAMLIENDSGFAHPVLLRFPSLALLLRDDWLKLSHALKLQGVVGVLQTAISHKPKIEVSVRRLSEKYLEETCERFGF
jgi:hypothetical protein